jgi:hypothetical protein
LSGSNAELLEKLELNRDDEHALKLLASRFVLLVRQGRVGWVVI